MIDRAIFHRAPLVPNRFAPLPLGAVTPRGWLRDQLQTAADGLTGHLADFWPDVGEHCGWLGGDGDGWERAPYYLDGLLPLAYLLEDAALIQKAQAYIEWTLASQGEDGWFGPAGNDDWWPRMVMLKVLMQYYTATADARVPTFMLKYCAYQAKHIKERPLRDWAVVRACDNIHVVLWLYSLTGKKWLLSLADELVSQSVDWTGHFHTFPYTRPMADILPWDEYLQNEKSPGFEMLTGHARPYHRTTYHLSHVVNNAMGLKYPGVLYALRGGQKHASGFAAGYEKLMKHHGVAYGMFTGDEHLSGASPAQGTECCAVTELMYTLEVLLGTTCEAQLGDILEKLAYNALPATLTPDMHGHQYLQQANQVKVSNEPRPWYNNGPDANVFGLEPHFGCCTANMHQGLPKFAASLWYAAQGGGVAAMSYAPCTVRTRAGGVPALFTVEGTYPYGDTVDIRISLARPAHFALHLRIPGWAQGGSITLPGGEIIHAQPGEYAQIERDWQDGDIVSLNLPMQPRVTQWYHQSAAVEVGPLLMALRPKERWTEIAPHPFSPDYQVEADSPWNYALVLDDAHPLCAQFTTDTDSAGRQRPTVRVAASAAPLAGWGMQGASAAPPPISPGVAGGDITQIALVPYGHTSLRIAQFPVARMQ